MVSFLSYETNLKIVNVHKKNSRRILDDYLNNFPKKPDPFVEKESRSL